MSHKYPFCAVKPQDYYGQKVMVHFNAHYGLFCLRNSNQELISHAEICIVRHVLFDVKQAGRNQAIATGQKNVHAFVVGRLDYMGWGEFDQLDYIQQNSFKRVGYDLKPEHPHFYLKDAAFYTPVLESAAAILFNKNVWAFA